MARVISCHDTYSLREAIYHGVGERGERYIKEQFENKIGRFGEEFKRRARAVCEKVTNSKLYSKSLASMRKLKTRGMLDTIRQLTNISELQNATPIMQRIVMANPVVKERRRKRLCEGYALTYVDPNPNAFQSTDRTYRQIMNGVSVNGKATTFHLTQEDKDEFTGQDRADSRITWAAVENEMRAMQEDPVSQLNASL